MAYRNTALAIGATVALVFGGTASASAAGTAAAEQDCVAATSADDVHVRDGPGVSFDSLGKMQPGVDYEWNCLYVDGELYTACGFTDDVWLGLWFNERWGFAAGRCLH
ncbi:hypothetical protein [Glycomyces sp. NPDC048151]|uniref:hypothetical protein n=1 Tax=Glycomyces sp. NPDC048151 TaxID=3364002 RepID=UPI00371E6643